MDDRPIMNQSEASPRTSGQRCEAWTLRPSKLKTSMHIDLYNFEDPKYANGKYVLTSPRSLDACSALGIKPVELLYRPLIDIQEELVPRGLPIRTIYSAYEETERERQNTLALCREEREHLIEQDEEREDSYGDFKTKTAKQATIKEDSADSGTEVDQDDVDDGSLQRQRTAWTTTIGHERVTREELEKRAQDLHARALALRQATLSLSKPKKKNGIAKATAKRNKSVLLVTGEEVKKPSTVKTGIKLRRTGPTASKKLRKKHKHGDSSERAPSVSDLSVTSTRSSRSPWLRDVTVDAKPISDPLLRNKLKSARSPGARVTSRDQKILELMMAKREEEKAAEKKRLAARRTWELQKQHEDAAKTSADLRRRESLVRQRQQKDITKGRRHTDSTDSLHSTYSERPDDHDTDCEDAHRYKDRQWSSQSQKITELREKKMAERRMQNMQRKKSQEDKKRAAEDRVAAQKQDQEDVMKMVRERQERELKRANSLKESKEHEALMQRKLKNYYMKKRHDERMDNLKRKSREDIHTLQSAIAMKQATAQSHLQAIQTRKYSELRRSTTGSMTDLDTRICRSKENQQRLQEEMSAWHEDLHNYRKMMEKRAEEQAKIAVAQKAKRAAEERCNKEKLQKKNFKKLLAQEEEWKADVEASIAIKDAKTRMLQMEKDETMQESRAMAAASQRMREELRSAYSSDTIDQLSKQAQLQAKLGLESYSVNAGLSGTTKNMSTLTLG